MQTEFNGHILLLTDVTLLGFTERFQVHQEHRLNVLKLSSVKLVSSVVFLYYPSADQESNLSCSLGV